jgi:uncharacterized protein YjbI with pentapeptide repeats
MNDYTSLSAELKWDRSNVNATDFMIVDAAVEGARAAGANFEGADLTIHKITASPDREASW